MEAKRAGKLSAPGPGRLCAEGTWVQIQGGGNDTLGVGTLVPGPEFFLMLLLTIHLAQPL